MGLLRRLLGVVVVGRASGYRRRLWRRIWATFRRAPTPAPASPRSAAPPAPVGGWVDVLAESDLPPGTLAEVRVGGKAVAVANVDGALHAVDGTCLHAGGPLGDGALDGDAVTCPYHGWSYDLRTGRCAVDDQLRLACHRVKVEGGRVWIAEHADPT